MDATGLGLDTRLHDPALRDHLSERWQRVGLEGVLRSRGSRAWSTRPPSAAAVDGFRWAWRDAWSQRWWPQGIDLRTETDAAGRPTRRILAVSWFAQLRRGLGQGSRITFVELRPGARSHRYHHVLLVDPERDDSGALTLKPVPVHAGGIAWDGDRILVAATFGGLRSFDVRDILRVPERGGPPFRRTAVPFGYRHVLPQSADHPLTREAAVDRARFSFVSVDRTPPAEAPDAAAAPTSSTRLIGGEYAGKRSDGRLFRVDVGAEGVERRRITGVAVPGIPRMQGACRVDGRWFVASSNSTSPGDLWTGDDLGAMTRHPAVLPAGPEDLAFDPVERRVWTLCEYPFHRRVLSIDPDRWR